MRNIFKYLIVLSLSIGVTSLNPVINVASQSNEDTRVLAQTTILSFFDQCCSGQWYSGSPQTEVESLPCPGSDSDDRGFVRQLGVNFTLENNQPANRSLETHPKWVANGYIYGVFNLNSFGITLQSGDRFLVEVGFLKGASEGRARFSVWYDDTSPGQSGGEVKMAEIVDSHDGKLRDISVDLSNFAGGSGAIILRVDALESSAQDWAVWVNPIIERTEAPTQTPAPTFTTLPSQTTIPTSSVTPSPTPIDIPTSTQLPLEPFMELASGFSYIEEGPVMDEALDDGDGDGVINLFDRCPNTPAVMSSRVFENGCLCQDSDGGLKYYQRGTVSYRLTEGEGSRTDSCSGDSLTEYACNPSYEVGGAEPYVTSDIDCTILGSDYQCRNDQCIPIFRTVPHFCWSAEGTCADNIQNQGEDGVDCGGICPPCNTNCTTGTRYAPPDTPCTSYYPTDMHRIDLPWTDNELEYTCQFHEVCHPDLDFVIEEALQCCSIRSTRSGMTNEECQRAEDEEINRMPDPNLCREVRRLTGQSAGCKRCVGLYIIRGLGDYARWMKGYTWLYPANNVYGDIGQLPAEQLINDFQTGICRDYAEAVSTLLRKAGYGPHDVGGRCDGTHCYNAVKLPGERGWHVVDTTGNNIGIVLGGLPSSHPYCQYFDETNWCWGGLRSTGDPCTGSELFERSHASNCEPGFACNRDLPSIPGWAPTFNEIIACGR
jgi:hypothetical protein